MYNFESSIALTDEGWVDKDISNETFQSLYLTYKKVYVNLFEDVQDKDVQLDLDLIKETYYFSTLTIQEYLLSNGNQFIDEVSENIKTLTKIKRLQYIDHSHNEIKVRPIKKGNGYTPDKIGYNTPDLEILNPDINNNNTLISINGFMHLIETVNGKSFVLNGYQTMLTNNTSNYGWYDFSELGTLDITPITEHNLFTVGYGYDIKLNNPIQEKDLIFLVINGLLFQLGEGCFQSSSESIGVKKRFFNWADITFNTQQALNTQLSLSTLTGLKDAAIVSELYSETNQRELLSSLNSFIITLTPTDTTQPIAQQTEVLYDNGISYGAYKGNYPPNGILRNAIKQCCIYVNSLADDECVVRTEQYQIPKYVYKTAGERVLRTPVDTLSLTWNGILTPYTVGSEMGYWITMKDSVTITPTPIIKDDVELGIFISKNINLDNPSTGGYFKIKFMRYLSGDVNQLSSYEVVTLDELNVTRLDLILTSGLEKQKSTFTRDYSAVVVNEVWESIEVVSNTINNPENSLINFMVDHPGEVNIEFNFYSGVIPPTQYLNQYIDKTVDLNQNGWISSHLTSLNLYQLK